MREYTVTFNFAGYIGCEQSYEVYADSLEEAKEIALQDAICDLEVISAWADEDGEEDDEPLTEMELAKQAAWNEVLEGVAP